jgi:hypothetical protein
MNNKPKWEDAPEWANYLAQDADGRWHWYKSEPISTSDEEWYSNSQWEQADTKIFSQNWDKTLEARPK